MVKDVRPEDNGLTPLNRKELIITSSLISRGLDLAKNITSFLYDSKRESLKMYLKEIRHTSLLTPKEEIYLSKRIKKGDEQARKLMIRANLHLVINIAKCYMHLGIPLLDLIEEGNLGLKKAVDKFNPRRGYRFSTFAPRWIEQSIKRFLSKQGKMMHIPAHSAKKAFGSLEAIDNAMTNKPPVIAFLKLLKDLIITEEDCGTLNSVRGKRNGFICESEHGICLKCYREYDLDGELAYVGENVGEQIAYAWGEIEMDSHSEDLLEARSPNNPAILSEIDGFVKVTEEYTGWKEIVVTSPTGIEREYRVSPDKEIKVRDGENVLAGQKLTGGKINPHDVLRICGDKELLEYMISEIKPYLSRFHFDERMIELPLRQMMRVEIEDPGDTDFVHGQIVNKFEFQKENVRVIKVGKHAAIGTPIFMGMRL